MLASIHNFVYLSFWTIFVWKLKIQYGAHFPWRPETRNKNSTGEKIDVKEEKISRNAYICALIHCTVKRVLGGKRTLRNSMDADHNFHSVERDVKGGERLI